jgi:hypothetical protein
VEKQIGAGQTTGDLAYFTMGRKGYKHTQRICNICCFSTAIINMEGEGFFLTTP